MKRNTYSATYLSIADSIWNLKQIIREYFCISGLNTGIFVIAILKFAIA